MFSAAPHVPCEVRKLTLAVALLAVFVVRPVSAEREALTDGTIAASRKISMTSGGFPGVLSDEDRFGSSLAALGDLDGDGQREIVVGAPATDDGGAERGAIWILSLDAGGVATRAQKISASEGGFGGALDDGDRFGFAVAALGDINADGAHEIAIGAPWDDDGGTDRGAVWIVSLHSDGTVVGEQKISLAAGGFTGTLGDRARFGRSLAVLPDLDQNGVPELAVGAPNDPEGGEDRGSLFVLFLDAGGTVLSQAKNNLFSPGQPPVPDGTRFGFSLALTDDLDDNGLRDLAVGSPGSDVTGENSGRVDLLLLEASGSTVWYDSIAVHHVDAHDEMGSSVADAGDLDGDGDRDLIAGAPLDDDGGVDRGAIWWFFLDRERTYSDRVKTSSETEALSGVLDDGDRFGRSLASVGDLDGDGVSELAVGAPDDDDGGFDRGAVWILFPQRTPDLVGRETLVSDRSPTVPASLGDFDGNGVPDLLVGCPLQDDGGSRRGAVKLMLLDAAGEVFDERTISSTQGGFVGPIADGDRFGKSVTSLGDLNGDLVTDIAVHQRDALWILNLNPDGTVLAEQKISATEGWVGAPPEEFQSDGVVNIGDVNGDGVTDIAVADGSADVGDRELQGLVHIVFLAADGRALSAQRITSLEGGLPELPDFALFGSGIAGLGDLDGNGVPDIAVGAAADAGDLPGEEGAVWILFLDATGKVESYREIPETVPGIDRTAGLGGDLANIGDLNGDGIVDLAVSATSDFEDGIEVGAIFLLFLETDGSVKAAHKITNSRGGLQLPLYDFSFFGAPLASPGDVDGDGHHDLAVALRDDRGLWLLSLQPPTEPPACFAGGPGPIACEDFPVTVQVGDPEAVVEGLSYSWSTTCPDAEFDASDAPAPMLTLVEPVSCTVTLTVTNETAVTSSCVAPIDVLPCGGMFPGDCNADGLIDLSDAVCVLTVLFLDNTRPLPCGDRKIGHPSNVVLLDWNGDAAVDLSDPVALLTSKFLGGPTHVLGRDCIVIEGCPTVCSDL